MQIAAVLRPGIIAGKHAHALGRTREEFNNYISFLEEELECPIKIVSVGPDRDQTIERYND